MYERAGTGVSNVATSQRTAFDRIVDLLISGDARFGFDRFGEVVDVVLAMKSPGAVLEVGAGRRPLLRPSTDYRLVLNDVLSGELELAGSDFEKIIFDLGDENLACDEKFDFLFSRSVLEHVPNGGAAFRNTYSLLNPGGIGLHFFPTLYAIPFLANRVVPEAVTERLLELVSPRDPVAHPKFPARYSWCRATASNERKIQAIGFSRVSLIPYFNHSYYQRLPLGSLVQAHIASALRRANCRLFAAYAFAVVEK